MKYNSKLNYISIVLKYPYNIDEHLFYLLYTYLYSYCLRFNTVTSNNKLMWIPGHSSINGNEKADTLAKKENIVNSPQR